MFDEDNDWIKKAACAGMAPKRDAETGDNPPDIFFPERGEPTETGKKICISCTVRKQCKQYRNETGSRDGMWGGEILKKDDK